MSVKRDDTKPLVFELPDGDKVSLITWGYVLKQLDEQLTPVVDHLSSMNKDLKRIDDKLEELTKES